MSMYQLDGSADDVRPAPCAGTTGRRLSPRKGCIRPAPSSWNSSCSPTSAMPKAACSRPARCSTGASAARPRSIPSTISTAWNRCFPTSTPPPKSRAFRAETVISEYAPGQYELTLNYRRNVMQAADDLVLLKRLVRAQARRHGVTACFMAKPIEKYAGSGMHLHVSLLDDAGRNVFSEAGGESWSLTLLRALGGLRRHHGRIDAGVCARTPIPGAVSCRNPMRPWRRPGASTTARWRCACQPATPRTGASSIAPPASTPTPISSPRPSWPASPRASTKARPRSGNDGQWL